MLWMSRKFSPSTQPRTLRYRNFMSKKMLINAGKFGETRVAVVKDGILEELGMETSGLNQIKGNIYAALVDHADRGLEAAFIDYGASRHGFIPLNEVPPKFFAPTGKAPSSARHRPTLKKNTKLLVQVDRDPIRNKGASFTGYISLPGRYLVVMPYSAGGGISRKIIDPKERDRLKNFIREFNIPENFGLIIRTAGFSVSLDELKKDYNELMAKWNSILSAYNASQKPGLISADLNLVIRSVRDYFSSDIEEVLVDDKEVYQSVLDFFRKSIPDSESIVKLHHGVTPLFSKFGLDAQIEGIFSRVVPLPTGGSIVIDSTEALVAIDVNSGAGKGSDGQEKLSLEINESAAVEIARQLRLRDLGGLIVIDFIDMRNVKLRAQVKRVLQHEMKKDKARVEIGNISKFGLMELSRQRVKASPYLSNFTPCVVCQGKGMAPTLKFLAMNLLRKISEAAAHAVIGSCVKVNGGREVVEFLSNERRTELQQIEADNNVSVHLFVDHGLTPGKEKLAFLPRGGGEKEKIIGKETGVDAKPGEKREGKPSRNFQARPRRPMKMKEPKAEEKKEAPEPEPFMPVPAPEDAAPIEETPQETKPLQEVQPQAEQPLEKSGGPAAKPAPFGRRKGSRRRFYRKRRVEKESSQAQPQPAQTQPQETMATGKEDY